MGRFINADGIIGANGGLVGYNLFAYCSNNPVIFEDDSGYAQRYTVMSDGGGSITHTKKAESKSRFIDNFKNRDQSYSLYDNRRIHPDSTFHEQVFSISTSNPSFDMSNKSFGLGSVEADFMTGGWEWDNVDVSLLDIGHAELSACYENGEFNVGAFASIWSPGASVTIFGIKIGLSAEIGAIGGSINANANGFDLTWAEGFGFSLSISWD